MQLKVATAGLASYALGMPICAHCGEENPARARFCLACGSPLAASGTGREVRKTVTVVFSDLVGSTPLGERLDPESLREVLTRYTTAPPRCSPVMAAPSPSSSGTP